MPSYIFNLRIFFNFKVYIKYSDEIGKIAFD